MGRFPVQAGQRACRAHFAIRPAGDALGVIPDALPHPVRIRCRRPLSCLRIFRNRIADHQRRGSLLLVDAGRHACPKLVIIARRHPCAPSPRCRFRTCGPSW